MSDINTQIEHWLELSESLRPSMLKWLRSFPRMIHQRQVTLRKLTQELAAAAESRGVDPSPLYTLAVDIENASPQVWGAAMAAANRMKSTMQQSTQKAANGKTFRVSDVVKLTGFTSTATINKYARMAGVPTPSRGQKDHRWTFAEVADILRIIIKHGNKSDADRCRNNLEMLMKTAS